MPDKEADSKPAHVSCFRDSGKSLKTSDGADIKIWELDPPSEEIKKAWAKSFRQNYCNDKDVKTEITTENFTKTLSTADPTYQAAGNSYVTV